MMLSDVCLSVCLTSVAYMRPKSRTERPRKTKIGTEVAHVTRDSDTTFKVKRLKVKVTRPLYLPLCWRVRHLQRWAWERVGRGKLLQCCYVAVCTARWRFGAHGEVRDVAFRGGRPLQFVLPVFSKCIMHSKRNLYMLLEQCDT